MGELAGDPDPTRRTLRATLVQRYPELPAPPHLSPDLEALLGRAEPDTNDAIDHLLIAAVDADSVDYLVTDDQGLIRKARRVGLGTRVLTPDDALATLRGLLRQLPATPPAVREVYVHELNEEDPIFDSFRSDYPGFAHWLRKCKREHRRAWIVEAEGSIAGVCIFKEEGDGEHGLPGRLLKLCSFKISDEARGYRFGELLLKPTFAFAFNNSFDHIYVEVFPKYGELIDLLEGFGFAERPARTEKDEVVLSKSLKFSQREYETLDAIEFHTRFGPRFLKTNDAFVVPIRPKYHDLLFPELVRQPELFEGTNPFGNSILKAYLCHSPSRQITPGSALLFYESGGSSTVRCLGVVEETLVSNDPDELARFVGRRTVYSQEEIVQMCSQPVLAILFRQASQVIAESIHLEQLLAEGVVAGIPRSITRVKEGGLRWLRDQIELSP